MAVRAAMQTVFEDSQRRQQQAAPTKAEVARLEVFAGFWHVEGHVYASAYGQAACWVSDEQYEWLPGGQFLINHWDARIGAREFQGMAVLGHDPADGYFASFCDNAGNAPLYHLSADNSVWTFSGNDQRARYEVSANAMKIHWDWRDGAHWRPLCDLSAARSRSASEVVLDFLDAFEAQDRDAAERLLADDFRFSSPRDDSLDRRAYMQQCWPNAGKLRALRIERLTESAVEGAESGTREVFLRYSAERTAGGVRLRNTEHIRVSRGRIRKVDVYFGRDL